MTKAPIDPPELRLELQDRRFDLQDLRRRIYRKAKSDKTHRFWGIFVHVTKMQTLEDAYRVAPASPPAPPPTATPPSTAAHLEGQRPYLLSASSATARGGSRNNHGLAMSVPLTLLSVPGPDDVLSVHKVVTSVTFWTTLLGAMTAFALGRFGQWRSTLNERRAAGNLAIVTLGEMYSEAKALYDSVFVVGSEEIRKQLGRQLLPFEYRAVISGRPTARNQFAGLIKLAEAHSRLSAEIQAALGKDDRTGKAPYRAQDVPEIVGPRRL